METLEIQGDCQNKDEKVLVNCTSRNPITIKLFMNSQIKRPSFIWLRRRMKVKAKENSDHFHRPYPTTGSNYSTLEDKRELRTL